MSGAGLLSVTTTYAYDRANRLPSETVGSTVNYMVGNLITAGNKSYTYDIKGRLTAESTSLDKYFGKAAIKENKEANSSAETIRDITFEIDSTLVLYHELLMTPENIGNYTYGYLRTSFGFRIKYY